MLASGGHTKPTKNIELSSAPMKNTDLSSENFRRKITQSRWKKLFSVGFGLSSGGFWPMEVSVIPVVHGSIC
jgi:hypothetical protein